MSDDAWKEFWGNALGDIEKDGVSEETVKAATDHYYGYYRTTLVPLRRGWIKQKNISTAMLAAHWLEMKRKPKELAALFDKHGVKKTNQAKDPEMTAFVWAMSKEVRDDEQPTTGDINKRVLHLSNLITAVQGVDQIEYGYLNTDVFHKFLTEHKQDAIRKRAQSIRDIIAKRVAREKQKAEERLKAQASASTNGREPNATDPGYEVNDEQELEDDIDELAIIPEPTAKPHPKNDKVVTYNLKTHEDLQRRLADKRNSRFVIAMEEGDIMLCEKDRDGRIVVVEWDGFDSDAFQQMLEDFRLVD